MTSAAVVLEVGAKPNGQASSGTLTSKCTLAAFAKLEPGLPVKVIRTFP